MGLSCGDLVLVYESAEDWFSADPVLGEVDRLRWPGVSLGRCELAESTVRAAGVVVPQVLGQYLAQVVLADDQQPVEELPAEGGGAQRVGLLRLQPSAALKCKVQRRAHGCHQC